MLIDLFLQEVGSKYAPSITIKDKDSSLLMKSANALIGIFNPKFNQYITTIGTTIYVPKGFMDRNPARILEVISHETKHVKDYKETPLRYVLGYGFPQLFSLLFIPLLITLLLLGCGWWSLFGLLPLILLAPFPAPWRYKRELTAYRTSLLMGKHVYCFSDMDLMATRNWIVSQLSEKWYYWTWPFPIKIKEDLMDEGYELEPYYQEVLAFCKRHNVKL